MTSEEIFKEALVYEKKIRDLYRSAAETIDDERGKKLFNALGDDEASHVDFLNYSLDRLRNNDTIDQERLSTAIPAEALLDKAVNALKNKIPERMLGDVKRALNAALKLENETSRFYEEACEKTDGAIQAVFKKFLRIEQRHADVVRMELDYASKNGHWFDFMEIDLEALD